MTITDVLLLVLPLVSAVLWLAVGIWPFWRYRFASPFQRSLSGAALLLASYALVDWFFLNTADFVPTVNTNVLITLAEIRGTLLTLAFLLVLLLSKWLYFGHSRADVPIALVAIGSLALVWGGMTVDVRLPTGGWGPVLQRNQLAYVVWLAVQLAYIAAAVVMILGIYAARRDLPKRLRNRIAASAGALLALMVAWVSTNVYATLVPGGGIPWFSSLLWIPAGVFIATFLTLGTEEIGEIFRAISAVERRVNAIYVFYRSGEPLVALGSGRNLPIEPEQLQGILELVGDFVETSMKEVRSYAVTSMHFDRLGLLAVRGQYIIVAAVYEGPAYDALRSELLRALRDFEERRWKELSTWEGASRIAEEVADELSFLVHRPGPQPPRDAAARPPNRGSGPRPPDASASPPR
jgi:hypothetical protein